MIAQFVLPELVLINELVKCKGVSQLNTVGLISRLVDVASDSSSRNILLSQ